MAETKESVVVTRKLTKVFRDFWLREKVAAVNDLDLDVYPREVFGLLGPNGSGKSTALKMILGLLNPTSGRIAIFGRHPTDVAIKNRIGYLPEESYLYPFLNARETLDFYGKLFQYPRRERQRRTDMLLEMVGLSSVAYRRVGEYSKGMQRRIGMAQALINDPDLLILDEPTSGMDPIGTRQFKDLVRTLAIRGKTVLISSHLLAEIEDICDRVSVLYGGRQRKLGSLEELLGQADRTQITTDDLDDESLQAVRLALAEKGHELLDVSCPRTRLESLFMEIVQEAQAERLKTGGAVAGGRVPEFLRGAPAEPEGRRIIEELVQEAETPEPHEPSAEGPSEPAAPAPAGPRREVLEELTTAAEALEPPAEASHAEPDDSSGPDSSGRDDRPQRRAGANVDRAFLDDLLQTEDGESDEPEESGPEESR